MIPIRIVNANCIPFEQPFPFKWLFRWLLSMWKRARTFYHVKIMCHTDVVNKKNNNNDSNNNKTWYWFKALCKALGGGGGWYKSVNRKCNVVYQAVSLFLFCVPLPLSDHQYLSFALHPFVLKIQLQLCHNDFKHSLRFYTDISWQKHLISTLSYTRNQRTPDVYEPVKRNQSILYSCVTLRLDWLWARIGIPNGRQIRINISIYTNKNKMFSCV